MKYVQLFLVMLIAPVLGFFLVFYIDNPFTKIQADSMVLPLHVTNNELYNSNNEIAEINQLTTDINKELTQIIEKMNQEKEELQNQKEMLDSLVLSSKQQITKSDQVLEQILSNLLGEPIGIHKGSNSTVKVYSLNEAGYRGYMAKVRPHTSNALKMVLAHDKVVSRGEITSAAAKRKGAILAVNAGGFWKTGDGQMAPLGITVVDGKIETFYDHPTLSFVGFNKQGHLTGGKISSQAELKQLNALQGASFVPTLLEDGKKTNIPSDWKNTRHPRTIVGNFSNGELLFIVIDGRREGWSKGVTLEEIQDKLLSFKIKDAFNLDGGGSSAFYFNGKLLNRPSDGRERPVTSNLVVLP
ncbi:phosphodiester glycosidase family protein [Bacillus sp. Marseille-P3661]|uniref:phosphodiester glycosidase family protein n=1 Tax=Bacillus sp. Marseille-P3661 TaxID=1936234 RepID=UPI000C84D417|nr:phosphodiester glycosidase family protein [Bacillus sp. Marseille-P3661]